MKRMLAAATLSAAIYFIPEWGWLAHLLWWAVVLTVDAALTAGSGFFVVRWLRQHIPDPAETLPPALIDHHSVRSGRRASVHRPMSCSHLRIRQFSTISAMTVWTKDEAGSYEPDEAITKVLDEETEWWECADCGERVSPDIEP